MATATWGAAAGLSADRQIDASLPSEADRRRSRLFAHLAFISCLCLQRFGLTIGEQSFVFFCLPLFLMLLAWVVVSGRGKVRVAPLVIFSLFVVEGLITTFVAINIPETRYQTSILSLFLLFTIHSCLLIGPTDRFDKAGTIDIFLFYARLAAALGIVQYLIQFAGLKIFSFMLAFPELSPILVEKFYNYNPIISYGSDIVRSNGFFLLEPSIFSQVLALAMLIEFFLKHSLKYFPLYGLAYLFSFSGTGLLAMAITIGILMSVDRRYTGRVLLFIVTLAVLATVVALLLPDLFASLAGRANEGSHSGSSGYARYFAQFDFIGQYTGKIRSLIGFGPGAMERSEYFFKGSANPALKLFIDYGILGLAIFASFLGAATWRRDLSVVSIFSLVNFQLGGGNLVFPPIIILTAMLCVWGDPPHQADAKASH